MKNIILMKQIEDTYRRGHCSTTQVLATEIEREGVCIPRGSSELSVTLHLATSLRDYRRFEIKVSLDGG